MAVISTGITLSYKAASATSYTELGNLQEIGDLGGDTEAIEITTLADTAHVYADGIKNYGDSLTFKFLYDVGQFNELIALSGATVNWLVTLPDDANCSFNGSCSVKLDGVGVNSALTYTLSIRPSSEMTWATT